MFKPKIFNVFIAFIFFINYCVAFNLSPVPNLEIKMPDLPTSLPQTRSSYFGFSIVLRENSILIGAPRAQSTLPSQSTINETGAIYRCPLKLRRTSELSGSVTCEPYIFESSSNAYYTDHRFNEIRDHQWLGATMDGGTKDNEPLLVCAPRFDGGERYGEEDHDYLHGICYRSADTLDDEPRKIDFWKLKPLTLGYQVYDGYYYFQMGQMGFSAHITPDNKEYIMGAPGINNWSGSVVRFSTRTEEYDIPEEISRNQLTLNGYAVASGYLNSVRRNQLYYVTTSPHENMELGQAYIFQYTRFGDDDIEIYAIFKGTQYGEYYGYAALVCDINGDKLDDVIITAPQYRLDGTIDIGAIYVYVNTGNFQFQRQIIEAPFTKEARFGSTIMNLGDINRDGYNDIAVGAPLADDNGVVVIYLGSKNGLERDYSQLLSIPSTSGLRNSYFGHGLSKGVDIDGNGYNDLAVGAPNNELVYIYRSYPVINVALSVTTSEPSLDLQAENIEYRVCFHIDSNTIVALELDIIADSKLRRIIFNDNNAQRLHVQVLAAKFEKCHNFNASITFLSSQVFVPVKTTVTHSLANDGKRQMEKGNFCTKCAVLDPRTPNTTISVLKYRHGCASEVCNVDLAIEALNVPAELVIGSSNVLPIKFYITNKFEKAFDTQVTISNSLNLTFARTPSNCYEGQNHQMICDIAKDQLFLEDFEYLDVEFELSNLTDKDELVIMATVSSMGNELQQEDNKIEQKIKLKRYSVLEIVGFPNEHSFIVRDDEPTINIEYYCKLHNLGPSAIKDIDLLLHVPIAYNDSNSRETFYIENKDIGFNVSLDNYEIPHSVFETLPTEQQNNILNDVTYSSRQHIRLPDNRTIFQYCNESNTAICTNSIFKLSLLEPSKSLSFNFKASIKSAALQDILQDGQLLALFMNVTVHSNKSLEGYVNITQLITPIIVKMRTTPETPLWIYIISIIGGILLLALLTLSMWKFGFFNRQTKEDMQQLLNEKLESERMKDSTELSNQSDGTSNETFEDIDTISRA